MASRSETQSQQCGPAAGQRNSSLTASEREHDYELLGRMCGQKSLTTFQLRLLLIREIKLKSLTGVKQDIVLRDLARNCNMGLITSND